MSTENRFHQRPSPRKEQRKNGRALHEQRSSRIFSFSFKPTYEEAYETFYLLHFRFGPIYRVIIGAGLTAVTVLMLVLFAGDSSRTHFLFIAVIAILLLFYELYAPAAQSRRSARKAVNANGTYKLALRSDGSLRFGREEWISINSDKHARVLETDRSFIIRPDSNHTICLPKRVIGRADLSDVRQILQLCRTYRKVGS